ncbi:MAG TPA: DUF4148 domain-containing protein [Albitalea sp.]|uniref:DUF4148 domain-containing protein n=1 Tax=Piscinibacter sp. TaxID=1903157 RepID=UPI002ECFEDA4
MKHIPLFNPPRSMGRTAATLSLAMAGTLFWSFAHAVEATQWEPQSAPQGKTRAEVKAELAEAQRMGDIVMGNTGLTQRELFLGRYPARPAVASRPRDEVKAELAEAQRNGDLVVGNTGATQREMFPARYPARPTVAGKTRDEVKAELAEAIRTGDIETGETGRTRREMFPGSYPRARADVQHASRGQSTAPASQ